MTLAATSEAGRAAMGAFLRQAERVVIKVGTSTLTYPDGRLHVSRMEQLVRQIADVANEGRQIVLVTSGAIGAGMSHLGLAERPTTIPQKQAAAAVGQGLLMHQYERIFAEHGYVIGQVLLTRDDLASRKRHLNSRNTIQALWDFQAIPVVNENDTVAVEEIRMGDNDLLAALVAGLISAQLLLILSDVDGMFDRDPQRHADARLLSVVEEITADLTDAAGGPGTSLGSGGMGTKLQAAKIAQMGGTATIIANSARPGVIRAAVEGEPVGSLFVPREEPLAGRKRWIAFYQPTQGRLQVDRGAAEALVHGGKSLLPAGIQAVVGAFEEGDVVQVVDAAGREIARGLVNYGAEELVQIIGRSSKDIEAVLGYKYLDEVIHRDNLALSS